MGFAIPVPMHHSGRRKALYLLGPSGVTLMASWKDGLIVDMVRWCLICTGTKGLQKVIHLL